MQAITLWPKWPKRPKRSPMLFAGGAPPGRRDRVARNGSQGWYPATRSALGTVSMTSPSDASSCSRSPSAQRTSSV